MDFLPASFRPGGRDRIRSVEDGMSGSTLQVPPPITRRATVIADNDDLTTFRHMVGIHSTKSLAANTATGVVDLGHNNLHFDGRAAPNLGIYNRVVHREQQAKRGYKFASLLINGCLGIQIIVAAALTAMGAANSSHGAITCFGAINTVIAGMLTYLKGSGLPNRLRYYENEWKKIREFIEQRERDFSRPGCNLDVHNVVRAIEHMYEEVKADIQTNTPDSYISVSDIRNRAAMSMTSPAVPKYLENHPQAKKLKEMEAKYGHKISEFLEGLAHKEEERMKGYEKGLMGGVEKEAEAGRERVQSRIFDRAGEIEKDIEAKGARVAELGKDIEKEAERRREGIEREIERRRDGVEKEAERRRDGITKAGRELEDEITFHEHQHQR